MSESENPPLVTGSDWFCLEPPPIHWLEWSGPEWYARFDVNTNEITFAEGFDPDRDISTFDPISRAYFMVFREIWLLRKEKEKLKRQLAEFYQ